MIQVQSSPPELDHSTTTLPTGYGSFNDHRSFSMQIAASDASGQLPPYLRYAEIPSIPVLPSINSPPTSTPSSPASLPRLTAVRPLKDALGSGYGEGGEEWSDGASSRTRGVAMPTTEEMQHPGDSSGENTVTESHRTGSDESDGSLTRVDLQDIGDDSLNFTTHTLRKCKSHVLKPYWFLLMFIGWRVFRHDVINPRSWQLRTLNFLYPVLIILLLLYTYTYEMIACEWKLNVVQDTEIRTSPKPTTVGPRNLTANVTSPLPILTLQPALTGSTTPSTAGAEGPMACDHIITTYLIPNLLHFVAYMVGLYYFRIQDNEQIYALMEKVFLQANPLHTSSSSQQKLVRKTRLFFVFGAVWVIMALVLQGLYVWAFDFPRLTIFQEIGTEMHWLAFSIELVGRTVFNSVILAVTINYATQCEMIMFYVKGLTLRLQEKSADIKTAFKDTWMLRQNLSLLNGVISKMTSLVLVILAELTVIGISILILNRYNICKVWVYRSLFPIVWGLMLGFPLFQAARVNSICLRIKKISLEMRVFGYKNSSQLELDSFLQFVHATSLKAKLFHVPVRPSFMMATCILGSFIFLLLVQTTSIVPHNNIV